MESTVSRPEWSGLETQPMKDARSSLVIPKMRTYEPRIKTLPRQTVQVLQDPGLSKDRGFIGEGGFEVDFKGCTMMQFEPLVDDSSQMMPVTMTVGGFCNFTRDSYKHFQILMRTKEESKQLKLVSNGDFEWPNVDCMLVCPFCGKSATVPNPSDTEGDSYWMLFYPLAQVVVQKGSKLTLGLRTVCRLACIECMETFLEGMLMVEKKSPMSDNRRRPSTIAFSLTAAEMLQEAGTVSFLQDSPPRPASMPNVDDEIDAWSLYCLWEHSGAWEALQIDYRRVMARSMLAKSKLPAPSSAPIVSKPADQFKAKERYGRKCGNKMCKRVHGKRDTETGDIVRLTVLCDRCKSAFYCSKTCRKAAADHHKESCATRRFEQLEMSKHRTRKVQCDTCKLPRPLSEMKKCSGCRKAVYCSVNCQRKDWPRHKITCPRK